MSKFFRYLLVNIFLFVYLFGLNVISVYGKDKKSAEANEAVLVEIASVQSQSFNKHITLTGTLRANQGVMVRPEVAGRITQIYFKSGTMVVAGTPLVQLNQEVILAQLQQSQAELQLAEQNYARTLALYKMRTLARADLDNVTSRLNAAKAKVNEYQAQLDQTLIKASFTGKLGLSAVNLGDYVHVGQDLVSLEALDPIEVEFSVPQVYLDNLVVGQNVNITADAYKGQKFSGKIYAIDAQINLSNRTVAVRATIPNAAGKLLPGTFVEAELDLTSKTTNLVIPQVAVFYDVGKSYVYKVVGDKVSKTQVELGDRDRENVVLISGLNVNDKIVTAGQLNIEDGAKIKITPQLQQPQQKKQQAPQAGK
jgi:membrane fusion protein, multidrug efflux system